VRVFGTAEILFGLRSCLFAEMDLRLGWGFLLLCFLALVFSVCSGFGNALVVL
jgi:hypothetical protein